MGRNGWYILATVQWQKAMKSFFKIGKLASESIANKRPFKGQLSCNYTVEEKHGYLKFPIDTSRLYVFPATETSIVRNSESLTAIVQRSEGKRTRCKHQRVKILIYGETACQMLFFHRYNTARKSQCVQVHETFYILISSRGKTAVIFSSREHKTY